MATKRWLLGRDVLIPLGVLGVIVSVDALLPPRVVVTGAFAVAAIVASATTTARRTAIVAVAATVLAAASAFWNHNLATVEWWVRLAVTVSIGALSVILAKVRVRREHALRHMTAIAEAVQRALLPAVPSSIGSLGVAARYVSATNEALVGGDLYEVTETSHGVRMILGDARGKGLDAVQMAATVLAAFRRAAATEPTLTALTTDLDNVVSAVAGDEDFVTAVLAEFHDDFTVSLVNCGHHPPLLLTDGDKSRLVDTGEPEPPWASTRHRRRSRASCPRAPVCCTTPTAWWRPATAREPSSRSRTARPRCAREVSGPHWTTCWASWSTTPGTGRTTTWRFSSSSARASAATPREHPAGSWRGGISRWR